MDRTEAFERMLSDLIKQAAYEQAEMDRLKAAGKEKTATYRQYFSNRLQNRDRTKFFHDGKKKSDKPITFIYDSVVARKIFRFFVPDPRHISFKRLKQHYAYQF